MTNFQKRNAGEGREIPGTLPRILYKSSTVTRYGDYHSWQEEVIEPAFAEDAHVASSHVIGTDKHAPVLDIDIPHTLVPSTTAGHSHLYLDVLLTWKKYKKLLKALAKAGIIEQGYYKASKRRGFTAARLPWIKKPTERLSYW